MKILDQIKANAVPVGTMRTAARGALPATCPRQMVGMLLASPRARSSPGVTEALAANPELAPEELQALKEVPTPEAEAPAGSDAESEAAHRVWHQEHAAEIAAEEGKP